MSRLTDVNKIGNALKSGVLQLKYNLEKKIEEDYLVRKLCDDAAYAFCVFFLQHDIHFVCFVS